MNIFILKTWLQARVTNDERGAGMVEYALLAVLIAVVCVAAVEVLGTRVNARYDVGDGLS